ncbi:efflux RND transporter permease subunit [Flavicella sp.]|uniref:efflux RND transporter permease subunit n=1 Tax=Flavicella sp. TaxID=2957742 RepID=UPI0030163644
MKQKINLIEAAMKYKQIALSLVVAMMIVGVLALMNMPRNEFPDFTIRQGVIVGIYPGASSDEVEEQLTKEVENFIFGYKEVNKVKTYSNSSEGQMILFVELNENIKNADEFWSKIRHGLGELKMQLPTGVLALIGNNDFGDTSALLLTMSSEEKSYRELEQIMKKLEAEVRKVSSVSKIKRLGVQDEKVFIYVRPEKLNEYNIQPLTILSSFKTQESMSYAGKLDNGDLILPVHLPPRYESEKDLENQVIYTDVAGNVIRLKDVARIERKYDTPDSYIKNNGKNAILLSLEMQQGNNIVQYGKEVLEVIDEFKSNISDDVEVNVISNQPEVVDLSISHFMKEFLLAIGAVILVTMILLPFRISAVAAITIPISILITLGIMQMIGLQLDIVSLAGLIVVLGMVVDNAIVIIDNHIEKLDHGETPWDAAWKAATELFIPVLSATAAIIASFLPLMFFLNGMAGDFVGAFPLTIAIALCISMIIALLLVPFLCYTFIKKGLHKKEGKKKKFDLLDKVQQGYDFVLEKSFKNPLVTISIGILSVIVALFFFNINDQQMFPALDRKQFAVEIYLPEGASLRKTEVIIDSLESVLLQDHRITNVASFVGTASPRFHSLYAPHMPSKNYGQILVNTISNDATIEVLKTYSEQHNLVFPGAHIKWKQLAMEGFPAPIEVRLAGNNIADIKSSAKQVAHILENHDNSTWVRNDWLEKRQGISIELAPNKANNLGYSKAFIAASLMVAMDGLPVTTMWEKDYPIDVILSKEENLTDDIDDLKNQYISSLLTQEVLPLRTIAKLKPEWTEGNIVHRNGVRTITVSADVKNGVMYSSMFAEVSPKIEALELPKGVTVSYGGENAEMITTYIPLGISLGVSIVLIFIILLFQFKTINKALLVMSTMLLSLFGASFGLYIIGYPFGLTSFIGIIGLMGITVRNGIILIDYAEQLGIESDLTIKQAAIAAGKRRMRPIFLTSMAAAIGVVPMIVSNSALWGPLGTVICFGLIFGMILTLFLLPVLYWKFIGKETQKSNITIV